MPHTTTYPTTVDSFVVPKFQDGANTSSLQDILSWIAAAVTATQTRTNLKLTTPTSPTSVSTLAEVRAALAALGLVVDGG